MFKTSHYSDNAVMRGKYIWEGCVHIIITETKYSVTSKQ